MPPIPSGTHVGPYEILSAISAGGMVYRARDPKLGRDVAMDCDRPCWPQRERHSFWLAGKGISRACLLPRVPQG